MSYPACPKCGHRPLPADQSLPAACPACGLVLAKFASMPVHAAAPDDADEDDAPQEKFFSYWLLHVPGEDLPHVTHFYKEAHPFYRQRVVIVGGKNSAAEAALEIHRAGGYVTMVHRGDAIHQNVKYWLKPNIENRIKAGDIPMHWRSTVKEVRPNSVVLATPDGDKEIRNDWVLAMTGYQPDTKFLEAHGIVFDAETKRPKTNPETLESDRKGMYLAGVIVAGMHTHEIFIENGRFHGKQIASAIAAVLK